MYARTLGWIPLDEGSARRRDLWLTTQPSHETDIHVPSVIRTRSPTMRADADTHLIPRGHRDRLSTSSRLKIMMLLVT